MLMIQSIRHAELAVRQAENGVLDAAPAQLELQGLTGRLAAQQQQLASTRHAQEMQGTDMCLFATNLAYPAGPLLDAKMVHSLMCVGRQISHQEGSFSSLFNKIAYMYSKT